MTSRNISNAFTVVGRLSTLAQGDYFKENVALRMCCFVFLRNRVIPETSYHVYKALLYLLNVMAEMYCLLYIQHKYSYISVDPLVRDDT
jgi:hypothetical protein